MKSAMIFTGSGPILVLTTFDSFESPDFVKRLEARGIPKFIAHEVSLEQVRRRYGTRFSVVTGDLSQSDDLRVMDIDGHHVFNSFSFDELGPAIYWPPVERRPVAQPAVAEEEPEGESLFVKLDEYGSVVESSYLPMVGSRITPTIEPANAPKQGRFLIDAQGIIVHGSPPVFNGRRLTLRGRVSPALGRTDTIAPTCTWQSVGEGGWT